MPTQFLLSLTSLSHLHARPDLVTSDDAICLNQPSATPTYSSLQMPLTRAHCNLHKHTHTHTPKTTKETTETKKKGECESSDNESTETHEEENGQWIYPPTQRQRE